MSKRAVSFIYNLIILMLISLISQHLCGYTPRFFEGMMMWFILVGVNKEDK